MTARTFVRRSVVLDCNPFDPDAINAAIDAVRAAAEAELGAGGRWEADHQPAGREIPPEDPDEPPTQTAGNVLTWTYYPPRGTPA